jgi:predicted  nucleic acid-binding Zn-ribbon protein
MPMNQSENILTWLRQLAELDATARRLNQNAPELAGIRERVEPLRALIPTSILGHYDHLKSRGKKGVAAATHDCCGNCHLALPRGRVAALRRLNGALNVCDNCGAFIYLDEAEMHVAPIGHIASEAPAPRATRRRSAVAKAAH